MLEDRRGHLWIGTAGGLTRYDSKTFTRYDLDNGLPDDWVRAMLEDRREAPIAE